MENNTGNILNTLNEFSKVKSKYEDSHNKNQEVVKLVNSLSNDFIIDKRERSPIKKFLKSFLPTKEYNFNPEEIKVKVNKLTEKVFERKYTVQLDIQEIDDIKSKIVDELKRQENEVKELEEKLINTDNDDEKSKIKRNINNLKTKIRVTQQSTKSFDVIKTNNENIIEKFDEVIDVVLPIVMLEGIQSSALLSQRKNIEMIDTFKQNTNNLLTITGEVNKKNTEDISRQSMEDVVNTEVLEKRDDLLKDSLEILKTRNIELKSHIDNVFNEQQKLMKLQSGDNNEDGI